MIFLMSCPGFCDFYLFSYYAVACQLNNKVLNHLSDERKKNCLNEGIIKLCELCNNNLRFIQFPLGNSCSKVTIFSPLFFFYTVTETHWFSKVNYT